MKHLGDITKINGYEVPIVDVVIGGSPCQGLSVAGKQLGLQDERSGLFMEQIRIVKEMREHDRRNGTDTVRPRYMVWENVPGATGTGNPKGEDFRIVLEEISKIADSQISIPRPQNGKWANAGCIIGDNFSIAWRILDGQWWGVPQRRRRIHLVADFNGQTAPEIVFGKEDYQCERITDISDTDTSVGHIGDESRPEIHAVTQGLSRNTESCGETWTSASEDAERSSATDDIKRTYGFDGHNGYITDEVSSTIGINCGMVSGRNGVIEITEPIVLESNQNHATITQNGISPTLVSSMGMGGGYVPMITDRPSMSFQERAGCEGGGKGILIQNDRTGALSTLQNQYVVDEVPSMYRKHGHSRNSDEPTVWEEAKIADTLNTADNTNARTPVLIVDEVYAVDMGGGKSACDILNGKSPTLCTTHYGEPAVVYDARGNGNGDICPTMTGDHQNRITDYTGVVIEVDRAAYNQGKNAQFDIGISEDGIAHTVVAKGPGAVAYGFDPNATRDVGALFIEETAKTLAPGSCPGFHDGVVINNERQYIVRRLTPLEAERLQGFPDFWTMIGDYTDSNGKVRKTSDSARYKSLGNSISLCNWKWVLKRISSQYERDATMASLFDGIGGFPYLWEQINGKGSCLWASEIEEFPMAVTKEHFGD